MYIVPTHLHTRGCGLVGVGGWVHSRQMYARGGHNSTEEFPSAGLFPFHRLVLPTVYRPWLYKTKSRPLRPCRHEKAPYFPCPPSKPPQTKKKT